MSLVHGVVHMHPSDRSWHTSQDRCVFLDLNGKRIPRVTSRLMTFWEFWRNLPRWAKRLSFGSIALGVICPALGLCGDLHNFWQHWGYGANFFSSLTGALFGVPFAAVLITWFTTSQERRMSQTSVETLSTRAWSDLKNAISAHIAILPPTLLREKAKAIADTFIAITAKIAAVKDRNPNAFHTISSARQPFDWGVDADGCGYVEDRAFIFAEAQKLTAEVTAMLAGVSAIGGSTDQYNRDWAAVCGRWQFLNTTVRAMRLSAGSEWGMPAGAEADFVYRFSASQSPINPTVYFLMTTMPVFVDALTRGIRADSPEELIKQMVQPKIKAINVPDWARNAANAAQILDDLQGAVRTVDDAGWPE
jgi:hypothetical protein